MKCFIRLVHDILLGIQIILGVALLMLVFAY